MRNLEFQIKTYLHSCTNNSFYNKISSKSTLNKKSITFESEIRAVTDCYTEGGHMHKKRGL